MPKRGDLITFLARRSRTKFTKIPITTRAAYGEQTISPQEITTARGHIRSSVRAGESLRDRHLAATGESPKKSSGKWMQTKGFGGVRMVITYRLRRSFLMRLCRDEFPKRSGIG